MNDTSIFTNYVDHNGANISERAKAARAIGIGVAWGKQSDTLREAAASVGAIVLAGSVEQGFICERYERLYLLSDVGGPWAVEVATRQDLEVSE